MVNVLRHVLRSSSLPLPVLTSFGVPSQRSMALPATRAPSLAPYTPTASALPPATTMMSLLVSVSSSTAAAPMWLITALIDSIALRVSSWYLGKHTGGGGGECHTGGWGSGVLM